MAHFRDLTGEQRRLDWRHAPLERARLVSDAVRADVNDRDVSAQKM